MTNRILAFAGLAGAVALSGSAAALAQDAGASPGPAGAYGHRDPGQWQAKMEAHRQQKAQELQAVLQLRPDQEGAFQTFEQATEPSRNAGHRGQRDAMANMTTPQRLDMMLSRMDQRMARLRGRVAATKQFYAALSPQQQRAFDGLMALRGHGRGFHGRHGRMG